MNGMACERCEAGRMRRTVIDHYQTRLGGMPLIIPQARVFRCDSCGDIAVEADELKRWRRIQSASLEKASVLPSSADMEKLREDLGISSADLAVLLGVTRQTVHGWQHGRLQIGPAALLIRLMEAELQGHISGVIDMLRDLAARRGTPVELTGRVAPSSP